MKCALPMLRRVAGLAMPLLSLALFATAALAGVPDPRFSIVPNCFGICPAGDESFSIVVRDVNNGGVAGSTVVLDLGACPGAIVALCGDCAEPSGYNPITRQILRVTDSNGVAAFHLCGSIYCPSGAARWVQVSASGVVLQYSTFVTPDLDGDGDVDAQDVALATAAAGTATAQADEDCSGAVDAADVGVVNAHLGHHCSGVVPAWGTVKAVYR
jgi:hypothetical protein